MKTKLSLLLALVICSSVAFAAAMPSVAVVPGASKHIFKLIYKSEESTRVQITIFNNLKQIVFNETVADMASFTRPYNFSQLPEGEYTIEVKDNFGKKIEKVNYSEGAIKSIISVFKLANTPSKYMLTAVNDGSNEITVNILNANGESLYHETLSVTGNFGLIYNLVEEGKYTFIISDKSGVNKTISY
ncbi:MAG TPA: hypothetical protein VL728_02000 [Cyclobacteriaceae bacterium]|jgi:hypothetical protein|nr:hypothetical protein [Cyclobacteriaceae bacterium]